jgi:hypothetical protein
MEMKESETFTFTTLAVISSFSQAKDKLITKSPESLTARFFAMRGLSPPPKFLFVI